VLDAPLAGVLDRYPELASMCVVPLGVSRFNTEVRMRPHSRAEAEAIVDAVHDWQDVFLTVLGHRLAFAADEYYLLAERPFPDAATYGAFPMHEDGIGMARAFEAELLGTAAAMAVTSAARPAAASAPCGATLAGPASLERDRGGFFQAADADVSGSADADYEPYRAVRATGDQLLRIGPSRHAPVAVLTAPYGARVLRPLIERLDRPDVRVVTVDNEYFGGNVAVSGLMVGSDLARMLDREPAGHRYLLPDVCLSQGRFLDGTEPADLPRPVEIVPTDGASLRAALGEG
jgi:NifB/MoaA-like Fe-S oxidoreductase